MVHLRKSGNWSRVSVIAPPKLIIVKTIVLLFLLVQIKVLSACSGFPVAFCQLHAKQPNDLVFSGVIVAKGTQSLQIKVMDVFRGAESRSVITIWDGKDWYCNGNVSMKVESIGSVGDSIVAIIPLINSIVNPWDVIGDYSRPEWRFAEPVLRISGDTIYGLISGDAPHWHLFKMHFEKFKTYWIENQGNCAGLVSVPEFKTESIPTVRQIGSELTIHLQGSSFYSITIYSIYGRKLKEIRALGVTAVDLQEYVAGLYILHVSNESNCWIKKVYWNGSAY